MECFSEMASRDMEMSASVNGIAAQFDKYDFLYDVMLGETVLKLVDNLSRNLQLKMLSAAEGHRAVMITCDTLLALSETEFVNFWDKVNNQKVREVGINDPVLPRKQRVPSEV